MEVEQVLHMNRGEDQTSYSNNSLLQKLVILKVRAILEKVIQRICHLGFPECITLAELGCSSGPNAILPIAEMAEIVDKLSQELNIQKPLNIQVFLNDLVGNDFNTVFKLLPSFYKQIQRKRGLASCFIGAMPGSFYSRLFPQHSVHLVHSSYSLHWLSQVPKGLVTESGFPLNKGNIYIAKTSPPSVHEAYLTQFQKDFTNFLSMRTEEMVSCGSLVLTFICKSDENDGCDFWELLGITLNDMVIEGLVEEAKLDKFNLPLYAPSTKELKQIIEKEGSFKLLHLETFKLKWDSNMASDSEKEAILFDEKSKAKYIAGNMRAVQESILVEHFGEEIMDDLFKRYGKKAIEYMKNGKGNINNVVMSLVKRNEKEKVVPV
ncbi:probable caffeine synthase MTL3 isoform X1 [Nicotiana tomentosiformis]|uniref:probable caffeine synthase MTL3 isoform X1 n=2 Tax=Nicotiana tomentosiformis TaxID=4098 RepID=UPI00051ACA2C|nr:7-methylxanthosine synthase 1-like isoform X1 [Nicotiana tomentosiformis]